MAEPPRGLLLDTHVLIWLAAGSLAKAPADALAAAALEAPLLVSPISAWEVGLLAGKQGRDRPRFDPDPETWFRTLLARPALAEAPFTAAIALAATRLPGDFHKDPADRLLVATARALNVPLATRDRRILAYAEAGHVRLMGC